jgi:OOP family OmpA-OmpF porin
MHRKKILFGALCGALAVAATGAQAAPGDNQGWYGGLDLSRAHLGLNGSNIDQAFAQQGIAGNTSIDRSHTAWGLDLGYRFNGNFALEGGYASFGKFNYSTPTTAPGADNIQGAFKAHAWSLAPVGILPLNDKWNLFGKAGLTRTTATLDASSTTGATAPAGGEHSNTGFLLGAGATYDITKNVYGKLEVDRYTRVGDASTTGRCDLDLFTLGVGVRF